MKQRCITKDRLEAFAKALRERDKSIGTREKYLRDVGCFAKWLNGAEITGENGAAWRDSLLKQGYAPASVNSMVAAVNQFLRHAGWEIYRIQPVKVQRKIFRDDRRELTREEYGRLVTAAHTLGRERLALLLETICATGIRVSELKFITVRHVRAGTARIALKGKVRTIMIPARLREKLLRYAAKHGICSGEVFLSGRGGALSRKRVWAEMKALSRRAGVEPAKVYPHNLRHLFARTFYSECRDVVKLADVLGHSSLETTRIYLISTGAEHRAMLERLRLIS